MKVSIITATFNSARHLQDCIDSVKSQDYPEIEHIVIDGLSTDNTVDIIKANAGDIAKWISEKDIGMYDAINKGMKIATGDIIGVLNSDDMLASSDVISSIVECFRKNSVDTIYGDLVYVDPNDTNRILRTWKGFSYKRFRFMLGWMPAHPTFYIRRSMIDHFGGYESHYFTAADFEFMARYLYRFRVSSHHLPKLIVKMRNGGASNESLSRRIRANRRDYFAMRRNNIPFPLLVSVLKPLRKVPQYYNTFINFFV
jgi:glycosyltransferase